MSGHRWLWGAILSGFLVVPATAQEPEVVRLRFEDNQAFSRAELSSAIVTEASRCRNPVYQLLLLCWAGVGVERADLDPDALEADAFRLKVYYYERGYREATIETDTTLVDPDEVRVTFRIQEGRPVRVGQVEVGGLPEGIPRDGLPIQPGQPFDVVAYEATRDTLQRRLWNNGFAYGQVLVGYTIQRASPYEATVRYDVYPGSYVRFGAVEVSGTEETSAELVHRMLTFEAGDEYDRSALLRSQRNLYRLQIFRHADVQASTEPRSDSLVPVTVRVAEGNTHRVRVGGGLNNVECANVEGRWSSRNFLGNGRRLTVRGRVGNLLIDRCGLIVNDDYIAYDSLTGLVSVDFTQPWFFGPRNSVGVGVFVERQNVPDVFVRSALGGYLSLTRSLGENAAVTLAYRPELTRLNTESELFFCVNFVACTFGAIEELLAPHWLSPVTLSFTLDRTDALFSPSEGFILRLDLEHANTYTGSDFAYSRLLGESSQYLGEPGGLILATRVRGGVGVPHADEQTLGLNPQKRFFAGGANSVRGYDQFRLGPTLLGIDAVPWLVQGDDPSTAAVEGAGCTMDEVNQGTCDAGALPERRFDVRPSGGEVLLEGNVELRFPLPIYGGNLRGAVFVDAGQVWQTVQTVDLTQIVATPGFGLRYQSPIGPLRLDVAFNTQRPQNLAVLTTEVQECQAGSSGCERVLHREPATFLRDTDDVVRLAPPVRFRSRIDSFGDVLNRFQIHFSIGQPF